MSLKSLIERGHGASGDGCLEDAGASEGKMGEETQICTGPLGLISEEREWRREGAKGSGAQEGPEQGFWAAGGPEEVLRSLQGADSGGRRGEVLGAWEEPRPRTPPSPQRAAGRGLPRGSHQGRWGQRVPQSRRSERPRRRQGGRGPRGEAGDPGQPHLRGSREALGCTGLVRVRESSPEVMGGGG